MWGEARRGHQAFFDLSGKDVDAAQDDHVITATCHFFHAAHHTCRAWQQPGQIAGPVPDDRERFFRERGKDQFTHLSVRCGLASFRVDNLWEKVVFPNVQPIFCFDTFH